MNPTPKILQSEINRGEKLLWWGQPAPMRTVLPSLPIFLFALPWTGFACFWICMAYRGTHHLAQRQAEAFNWIFPLFGLPFVFIGLSLLSLPMLSYFKARKTYYALTDKRLLILTDGREKTVENLDFKSLSNGVRTEYGGRGDLTWTTSTPRQNSPPVGFLLSSRLPPLSNIVTLTGIKEPRKVEKMLEDCRKNNGLTEIEPARKDG